MLAGLNFCGFKQDLLFSCCASSDSALSTAASKQQQLPRTIYLLSEFTACTQKRVFLGLQHGSSSSSQVQSHYYYSWSCFMI
jgi:hypothetical protein